MSADASNEGGGLAPLPVPPLPVTVISGYLGAGKTTLVNRLLTEAHGRRITVLVNDFGEIPLDESLILNRDGDTLSLANGCMCCSIGGDLFDAIDRILEARPRAEHLVIETSGVADPAKVAQIAMAEPEMDLALTATLVDAANFEAGLDDPLLSDTLVRQVRAAGLVVISKADHAGPEAAARVAATLAEMAPAVPRLEAAFGALPVEMLLDRGETPAPADHVCGPDCGHDHDHSHDPAHDHAAHYRSWSWSGPEALDRAAAEALVAALDLGLYRLKGVARTPGGWVEFHRAGAQTSFHPAEAPADGLSRAVAIGFAARFDAAALDARWRALLV
ncbi:GTP-binding protein [Albimonas sp. CAU 1670]|uniref:CobW family GTP-binding protein n=1 Tax=Albimonas sp. CAU 1670 TaxID=3032599 RepID=UPI0023DC5959|nr:CobW family GTP-binding protein [Albimonas sp. CAU 1670]MDF2233687.1 GTP-binding protein [Albimonas sp. CAU 1670]